MQADVHFHLLPGVDDGPADLGESLALARAAVDDGTTIVVATPHVSLVAVQTLPEQVAALQGELDGAGIPLDVRTGGELNVHDVDECTEAELETLALGPPGRRWQLLETPFRGLGPLHQAARRLRELDYGILLAHPERCSGLWDDHAVALRHELDHGAWLQVSGASLVGAHGANVRRRALGLVRAYADRLLIASDAHSPRRPPMLRAAAGVLAAEGIAADTVDRVVVRAPLALLDGGG